MTDFFEIDFLDVETGKSGDAICLRYKINGSVYIHVADGGFQNTGTKLAEHIREFYGNPSYINHVICTHNDQDHAGGLRTILGEFDIGALWMLRPWLYADELIQNFSRFSNVESLRKRLRDDFANLAALEDIANERGLPIYEPFQGAQIGHFRVMAPTRKRFLDLVVESEKTPDAVQEKALQSLGTVIADFGKRVKAYVAAEWGIETFPSEGTSTENEMSVAQYANLCGKSILLTADTGRDGLQEVIDYAPYAGLMLPGIDRFQTPHHGSRRNLTSELLDSLLGPRLRSRPENGSFTAIISSAKADADHPRKVVVRALHHRGAKVVTTEGQSIQSNHNAPQRNGWSAVLPTPYPD